MKVTRLKRGWRIRLTDSEMGTLSAIVDQAEAGEIEEAQIQYLEPSQKAAWSRRTAAGPFLRMDQDRR